jgi:hypothetical protein
MPPSKPWWLKSLSQNFPIQIFTKIHSVRRRIFIRTDGQNHFNRYSVQIRMNLKQNHDKRWTIKNAILGQDKSVWKNKTLKLHLRYSKDTVS